MSKTNGKAMVLREEDYWLYPIIFFNVIFGAAAIYASVLMFRAPALVLFCAGLWFSSSKVRSGYSARAAKMHVALTIVLSLIAAFLFYELTN